MPPICVMGGKTNKQKKKQTPPTWIQFSVKMDLLREEKRTERFSYAMLQVFRKREGLHKSVHSSFSLGYRISTYYSNVCWGKQTTLQDEFWNLSHIYTAKI